MSIKTEYESARDKPSDINEHLETLHAYARSATHISECGVRTCVSTWAFLSGLLDNGKKEKTLVAVDLEHHPNIDKAAKLATQAGINYRFIKHDSATVELEATDILFIDTWHVGEHLRRELRKHHSIVRKYIILHDTTVDGEVGESIRCRFDIAAQVKSTGYPELGIREGLWSAVVEFMSSYSWRVVKRYHHNNGLTILERCKDSIPAIPYILSYAGDHALLLSDEPENITVPEDTLTSEIHDKTVQDDISYQKYDLVYLDTKRWIHLIPSLQFKTLIIAPGIIDDPVVLQKTGLPRYLLTDGRPTSLDRVDWKKTFVASQYAYRPRAIISIQLPIRERVTFPLYVHAFDKLGYVRNMVDQLSSYGSVIVLDHASNYTPLTQYYQDNPDLTVIYLPKKMTHEEWITENVDKLPSVFFATQPEIQLNQVLPSDWLNILLMLSDKWQVWKAGCALDITNSHKFKHTEPSKYSWESNFWRPVRPIREMEIDNIECYWAPIASSPAVYNKKYMKKDIPNWLFLPALRVAGDYMARCYTWEISPPFELDQI